MTRFFKKFLPDNKENDDKNEKPAQTRIIISRVSNFINGLKTLLFNIGIILFAFVIVIISFEEYTSEKLIIEPFSIPEELEKNGYTGQVIAKHIMDSYYSIYEDARTQLNIKSVTSEWTEDKVDIEMPGTGVSISSLKRILRYFHTGNTIISGEIIQNPDNKNYIMTLRIRGIKQGPGSNIYKANTLHSLIDQAAMDIIRQTTEYIMACYLIEKGEYEKGMESIENILKLFSNDMENQKKQAWAYILKAQIKEKNGEYEKALEQIDLSIEKNPEFAIAYFNKGVILFKHKKLYNSSISVFEKYITYVTNDEHAYFYLAQAYGKGNLSNYSKAELNFKKCLKNSKDTDDYVKHKAYYINFMNDWAQKLKKDNEYEKSIEKYRQIFVIDHGFNDREIKKRCKCKGDGKVIKQCYYTVLRDAMKNFFTVLIENKFKDDPKNLYITEYKRKMMKILPENFQQDVLESIARNHERITDGPG